MNKTKNNSGTRLTISSTNNASALYATKDITLDFYIICSFDPNYGQLNTRSANNANWIVGNNATVTMDGTKKYSNDSYIYGNTSLLPGGTNDEARLYYKGGERLFGIKTNISSGNATFPSVNLGAEEGLCVGWVESDAPEYKEPTYIAGDKIPHSGNYYMTVYTKEDDEVALPKELLLPSQDTAVYFVGDSRTHYMGCALTNYQNWLPPHKTILAEDKVNIIAESGQGLKWFKEEGLTQLKNKLAVNNGKNHIIIMNLGVNDAAGVGGPEIYDEANRYVGYMRDNVYNPLKALYGDKIKFFYMSINPLCSQAVKDSGWPGYSVTEQNVVNFNQKIRDGLCSGSNKYFTYIDAYGMLMEKGWFPQFTDNTHTEYDGIHYYEHTLMRIYNFCMNEIKK